jgi:hypothetical protein
VNPTKLLASFGALALFITACGDDNGDTDNGTTTNTTPPATDPDPTTSGTTAAPATCMTDICMTYGAAVPKVASDITDQAAADPMFMADFAPLVAEGAPAVQAFKDSLAAFISDAYGCSMGAYTGPTMQAAHAGLGITEDEYSAFITLIAGVLSANGVPDADINDCFAPPLVADEFRATIVGL